MALSRSAWRKAAPGFQAKARAGHVIARAPIEPFLRTVSNRAEEIAAIGVHMGEVRRQGQQPRNVFRKPGPCRKMKRRHVHLIGHVRVDPGAHERLSSLLTKSPLSDSM